MMPCSKGRVDRVFQKMGCAESKLREEVDFWRSMLREWQPQQSELVRTRVIDALAFAELKLELLLVKEGRWSGEELSPGHHRYQ